MLTKLLDLGVQSAYMWWIRDFVTDPLPSKPDTLHWCAARLCAEPSSLVSLHLRLHTNPHYKHNRFVNDRTVVGLIQNKEHMKKQYLRAESHSRRGGISDPQACSCEEQASLCACSWSPLAGLQSFCSLNKLTFDSWRWNHGSYIFLLWLVTPNDVHLIGCLVWSETQWKTEGCLRQQPCYHLARVYHRPHITEVC